MLHGDAYVNDGGPDSATGQVKRWSVPYRGQPYFCSEFGGTRVAPEHAKTDDQKTIWGYGERTKSPDEFYARFAGSCAALLNNPAALG